MRRFAIASLIACALAAPSVGFAQSSTPGIDAPSTDQELGQRQRVAMLLSAYHALPERELFERASPDARAILLELAADEELFPPHRVRALDALARYWGGPETFSLLAGAISSPRTADATRHDLLMIAARNFEEASVPLVLPYLSHSDLQLRVTAIYALGAVDTETSQAILLDAREHSMRTELEQKAITRALQSLR